MAATVEAVKKLLGSRLNIGGQVDQYGGQPVKEEDVLVEINRQYPKVNGVLSTIYRYPLQEHAIVDVIVNTFAAGYILHANHQNDLEKSPDGEYATLLIREAEQLLQQLQDKEILLDGETIKTPLVTAPSNFGNTIVGNRERNNPWQPHSAQQTKMH
jgi:hypothetical protein